MLQIKDQGKNAQGQINEEIDNLPERIQSYDSKDDPRSQTQCKHRLTKYKKCLTKT